MVTEGFPVAGPRGISSRRGRYGPPESRLPRRPAAARWALASLASVAAALSMQPGPNARSESGRDPGPGTSRVDAAVAALGGRPVVSRLERVRDSLGGQVLRGETRLLWGKDDSTLVSEETTLDRAGRLLHAEIQLRSGGGTSVLSLLQRISLDASQGTIARVTREGRTERRRVATDLPWAYVPVEAPGGAPASTPIAVLVAELAAEKGAALRLIDARGADAAILSDQVLVSNRPEQDGRQGQARDAESWVVLGDDLATFRTNETGKNELVRLRIAAVGVDVTLQPTEGSAPRM